MASATSPLDRNLPLINANAQALIQGLIGCSPNSPASEISSASSATSAPGLGLSPALSGTSLKPQVNTMAHQLPQSRASSMPERLAGKAAEATENHPEPKPASPSSLEVKIHNFLKVNPGFKALDLNIPLLSHLGTTDPSAKTQPPSSEGTGNAMLENQEGTPVRDERGGTPTQDEMMDKTSPIAAVVGDPMSLLSKLISPPSSSSTSSPPSPPPSLALQGAREPSVPSYQTNATSPYSLARDPFLSTYEPPLRDVEQPLSP
uniref:Uncharacterized protein n=1 Tax=Callorhinchus milii TaxID=7868 RepID=A0A4W3GEK9_CALMI